MAKFPDNFLWGASTSAYQVEGAIDVDGKVESTMDVFSKSKYYPKDIADFSIASDHYHNWKQDIALMAEMGFKSYRFSLSWPRIMKNENGEINPLGIKFYNDLIDELLKYNIEPVVTIFHFDLPMYISKIGGLSIVKFADLFETYAKICFENFGKKVKYWLTINELNMFLLVGDMIGLITNTSANKFQVTHYLNLAQAKAINLCHKMCPNAKIGPVPNISTVYPLTSKPKDYFAKLKMDQIRNWMYLDVACKGRYSSFYLNYLKKINQEIKITKEEIDIIKQAKPDFIAINYYTTMTVKEWKQQSENCGKGDQHSNMSIPYIATMVKNENLDKTKFGWEIDPVGFKNTLWEVYDRYNLPIMITENGLGMSDVLTEDFKVHDQYRIKYYQEHLEQLSQAIEEGCDVFGYMPWSAIDLVSTHEGVKKRYGFIYVDRDEKNVKQLKRYRKDSFYWYRDVILSNGEKLK